MLFCFVFSPCFLECLAASISPTPLQNSGSTTHHQMLWQSLETCLRCKSVLINSYSVSFSFKRSLCRKGFWLQSGSLFSSFTLDFFFFCTITGLEQCLKIKLLSVSKWNDLEVKASFSFLWVLLTFLTLIHKCNSCLINKHSLTMTHCTILPHTQFTYVSTYL